MQTAALALGRLANHNRDLAEAIVKGDILPQLVNSLTEQNVICDHMLPVSVIIPPLLLSSPPPLLPSSSPPLPPLPLPSPSPLSSSPPLPLLPLPSPPLLPFPLSLSPLPLHSLSIQRFYKKAAAFVLRAVAKHSPTLAQAVVDRYTHTAGPTPCTLCNELCDSSSDNYTAWTSVDIAKEHLGGGGGYCVRV